MKRLVLLIAGVCSAATLDPASQTALDQITPAHLRANLSFLSSDLLEGRDTPSRGLDLAAEFIAAQFRRAGLEPVFQTADYSLITADPTSPTVTINGSVFKGKMELQASEAVHIVDAPLHKVENATPGSLEGKVAVLSVPDFRAEGAHENLETYQRWLAAAKAKHPSAILLYYEGEGPRRSGHRGPRLIEASAAKQAIPVLTITDPEAVKLLAAKGKVSIEAAAPQVKTAKVSNVTALLKGSDPALANTYILVTSHYDHLGVKSEGDGDRIFNGANDDGSGTVSVIEVANALAGMNPRPKRSILFVTFFGEEKGLLGSRYYAGHPMVPLKDTVAQVNLEQLGRTDDTEGPQVGTATFTGFNFSDLPTTFQTAGAETGVKVYNSEKNGDDYFGRSDNQSLADAGIPSHTVAVAFDFPDYHGVADEWNKIDYENLAKVDRMVALGLIHMADNPAPPKWDESNPKAEKYVTAWKALHK
jgi:Peptidase family M28